MSIFDRFKKQDKSSEAAPDIPNTEQLKDFHPFDTGLAQTISALSKEFHENGLPARKPCDREQFIALLAGISALRKTPGIPTPGQSDGNYFTTLPRCATTEAEAECRAHLEKIFGITDKESLVGFCMQEICCHRQYLDFVGFWEGNPPFDMAQLNEDARQYFQTARDFSAQFFPIVKHHGYLAWDITECVGHLRSGYACGILTKNELNELAEHWITQAQVFENWADFAESVLCGYLYWDFRHDAKLPELNEGLDLWTKLVCILLNDDTAWGSGLWYTPIGEA